MDIPGVDQFGGAQPIAPARVDTSAAYAGAGQGLLAFGQSTAGIAADMRDRQATQQRAQSALTLANITNDLHDAHDAVARGVLDGSIDSTKANEEFGRQAQDVVSSSIQNLRPEQQDEIRAHTATVSGALDRSLTGAVVARQKSEVGATIDQFGEAVSRQVPQVGPGWAADKFAAMVDFSGGAAGLTPEQAAKKKQAFRETANYTFFDGAGTDALTKMDSAAVGAVIARVKGPEGDDLDPLKRTQLVHQLFGYQQHIDAINARDANAAENERIRRENLATDFYNKGTDMILSGGVPSPEWIKSATEAASGTSQAGPLVNLLAQQRTFGGFATQPAPARAALLDQMRGARTNPDVGTDPANEALYKKASELDSKLNEMAKDNPWQAATLAGAIPQAPLISAANASDALSIVQQRMADIGRVEAWAGHKVSPLQPQEADQVAKMIRTMPPDQAATMLGSLGATVSDSDRVAMLSKQIKDKDDTLGLAMGYGTTQTTEGRHVAELILRGDQAIKDKSIKPDSTISTGWMADITSKVRGAYANQEVENNVVRAAYLINAARGREGNDDTDDAIRLATGGGIIDFNGSKVAMPVGYAAEGGQSGAESKFRSAIANVDPGQFFAQMPDGKARVGNTEIPGSQFVEGLKDAQLVTAGAGRYAVKAGNTLVTNTRGQPIIVKLP